MKIRAVVLAGLALLVAACSSGPVKRVSPPTASIQELSVQADGSWRLLVRIQNFSNVPMTFSAIKADLDIAGSEVGKISKSMDLDMAGGSADVVELTLNPSSTTPLTGNFAYDMKGEIESSDPKGSYKFDRSSHLSAVPGRPNTWR